MVVAFVGQVAASLVGLLRAGWCAATRRDGRSSGVRLDPRIVWPNRARISRRPSPRRQCLHLERPWTPSTARARPHLCIAPQARHSRRRAASAHNPARSISTPAVHDGLVLTTPTSATSTLRREDRTPTGVTTCWLRVGLASRADGRVYCGEDARGFDATGRRRSSSRS